MRKEFDEVMLTPIRERKSGAIATLAALLRGARPGTPMRQLSSYAPPFSAARLVLRFGLAYELLREICSVPHCIAEMHNRSVDEQGWRTTQIRAFPAIQQDALLQARSSGIQSLRSRHPWLTGFDVALYLEGFEAGASFQLGTPRKAELRISVPSQHPIHSEPLDLDRSAV